LVHDGEAVEHKRSGQAGSQLLPLGQLGGESSSMSFGLEADRRQQFGYPVLDE
jgi:hypothetical protein